MSIVCKQVVKKYGTTEVLHGIDLELEKGKIYGLIGRNGAGKTTLLSAMSGQNPFQSGEVTVDGLKVWDNQEALDKICFSREINPSNSKGTGAIKVKDYLKYASIYMPNYDKELEQELVKEFNLDVKKKLSKLSKGMLSMVTIIVALASKAEYTFLDEPVAGLDVVARQHFYRHLLDEFAESGRTFVVSTHIIEEAADIFEEVIFLDNGDVLLKENTQELVERVIHVSGKEEDVDAICEDRKVYAIEKLGRSKGATVMLEPGETLKSNVGDVTVQGMSLQQVFLAMCGQEA